MFFYVFVKIRKLGDKGKHVKPKFRNPRCDPKKYVNPNSQFQGVTQKKYVNTNSQIQGVTQKRGCKSDLRKKEKPNLCSVKSKGPSFIMWVCEIVNLLSEFQRLCTKFDQVDMETR